MNRTLWKVAPLLFGSGACALIYQTVWLRELRLVFGASTAASAAVLAIFMAGLGVGSALLGKRAERLDHPLRFYARLEFIVATGAAFTPILVWVVRAAYLGLGGTVVLGQAGGTAARLLLSLLVLGLPALAMGGTLPAAACAAVSPEDQGRKGLAVLYGLNALGAVAGAASSTFFLFEALGTRNTLWLACGINTLIACVAAWLSRYEKPLIYSSKQSPAEAEEIERADLLPRLWVWGAAAMTGFVFFLMEMVWYRLLSPLLGGSTYTFGLILCLALLGIGIGGATYAWVGRRRQATVRGFAFTCALEALALGLPFLAGDRLAVLALLARPSPGATFSQLVASWTLVGSLAILAPAIVAGFQFPLLISLLGRGSRQVGRQVGAAYAWNTAGSILGALAGGFGLLPLLSASGTWRLAVLLLCALAAALLSAAASGEPRRIRLLGPALVSAIAALVMLAPGPSAAWRHSPIGAGRVDQAEPTFNSLRKWLRQTRSSVIWEQDGVESTVALANTDALSFIVNGKVDGNAIGDAPTQILSGLLGAMFHPGPRAALVVGLGTGSTAGWLASVPGIERVDAVEIEPGILEVARQCSPVNRQALENPKVRIHLADAREVLLASKEHYDVISSEPSNPYRAGIASLFTREFYRAVKERLSGEGVFCQWLQAYEVDTQTVRSTLATLASEFGSVETWQTQSGDLLMMARRRAQPYDVAALRARMALEPYRSALLHTWRASSLEEVFSHFVAGNDFSKQALKDLGAQLNTDDWSYLEFGFARNVGGGAQVSIKAFIEAARRLGAERPPVAGSVDWDRVEVGRLHAQLAGGESLSDATISSSRLARERFALYARISAGDLTGAVAMWRERPWLPVEPVERILIAGLLAEVADPVAVELLEPLRKDFPGEAAVIVARLRLKERRIPEAAAALLEAFQVFRSVPWSLQKSVQDSLDTALEIAALDIGEGRRLYRNLERPFAAWAKNQYRLSTRVRLAGRVNFQELCEEALVPFEPQFPWSKVELSVRASCYEATRNPRVAAARMDQEQFLSGEKEPLSAIFIAP